MKNIIKNHNLNVYDHIDFITNKIEYNINTINTCKYIQINSPSLTSTFQNTYKTSLTGFTTSVTSNNIIFTAPVVTGYVTNLIHYNINAGYLIIPKKRLFNFNEINDIVHYFLTHNVSIISKDFVLPQNISWDVPAPV